MSEQKTLFGKSDAANYRDLTEPRLVDEVNASIKAFAEELYELRNKHRIADLMFVVRPAVKYDDGEIGCPMLLNHFGDSVLTEGMAAYAFGKASAERQEATQRIVGEAAKSIKNMSRKK